LVRTVTLRGVEKASRASALLQILRGSAARCRSALARDALEPATNNQQPTTNNQQPTTNN